VYLTNSVSDGKVDNSKKNKKMMFYWAMIIVTISTGVSVMILGYGFAGYWENDVIIVEEKEDCDLLLREARLLIDKNDNVLDVDQWELEEDTIEIREINQRYSDNCIPTEEEVMGDLKRCTAILITIETLIDRMVERHLNTLSEDEQKAYNHSYEEYFNNYCNKIIDEIQKTDEFLQFNKTRGQ